MSKKISNIIKSVIISILFLITIFLILKSNTKASVLGQTWGDDLGSYAVSNGSEFVSESYSNLLNQSLSLKSRQAGHAWGVKYRSSACLYHNATMIGSDDGSLLVKDVIDMGVNSNGDYYATSYYDGTSHTITGTHAFRLAASIKYAVLNGTDVPDGGSYVIDWSESGQWRTIVFKYFYQAIDSDGGGLHVSNWFNTSYVNRTYPFDNYKTISNTATQKVESETNSAGNFRVISKPENQSNIEIKESSSNYTVLGPFRVSYGGKDVGSVEIQDANNSNSVITDLSFQYSKNVNGDWTNVGSGTFPNNEDVYIKVIGNIASYNKINVKFYQKAATFLKARMIMGKNQGRANNYSSQNIAYYGYTEGNQSGSVIFSEVIINPGIIEVEKVDAVSKDNLNFKFKVQTKKKSDESVIGWLKDNNNGTYTYNVEENDATEFSTTDGIKKLEHLSITECEYKLIETETPQNGSGRTYILEEQVGYNSEKGYVELTDWFDLNTMQSFTYKKKVENDPRVSISGYVWIDKMEKGDKKPDNFYDGNSADLRLEGVKVTLYKKGNETPIGDPVYTDANGEYKFDRRVLYKQLNDYYVEYDYSSLNIEYGVNVDRDGNETIIYKNGREFIPVAYNSANFGEIELEGSRAIMDSIPEKDVDLYNKNGDGQITGSGGLASTYKGTDSEELETFGLLSLAQISTNGNEDEKLLLRYDEDTKIHELHDINLGIKPIYEPVYEIAEDLDYVKIILGGYEYVYYYGNKIGPRTTDIYKEMVKEEENGVPFVEKQKENNPYGYEQPMYPTDIYHNQKYSSLEVYAVYQIKIINKTVHDDIELYKEDALHITSLQNQFMNSRYELATEIKGTESEDTDFKAHEEAISGNFSKWSASGGMATYNLENDPINLAPGKETDRYIQFKVKNEELERILANDETTDISAPTTAITQGYHTYYREDFSWTNKWYNENESKGKQTLHQSRNKEARDAAPFLRFKLGEERIISGKVFRDENTGEHENEILGNGLYDDNEWLGKNVTVRLIDPVTKETVKVYVPNEEDKTKAKETDAEVYSDEDGNYSIKGVVPGKYYVVFDYGKEGQTVINKEKTESENISTTKYKSTIITSEIVKDAIKNKEENTYGNEWYKHIEKDNYSTAVDDLDMRKDINERKAVGETISALTPKMDITIENTVKTTTKMNENEAIEENVLKNPIHEYNFNKINFGIIEQPHQILKLSKMITNVKLENTPNLLFDGNPEKSDISGVTDLDGDNNNGGSTYTRMEIEKENIYGSKLSLRYEIKVENVSNKNYYERKKENKGWYYMFGEHNPSYSGEVKISVQDIIDCYHPNMLDITEEEDKNEKIVKTLKVLKTGESSYTIETGGNDDEEDSIEAQAAYTNYEYKEVLSITKWKVLDLKDNKVDKTKLEFSKILSSKDDDLDYINGSGIATAKNVTDEKDMEEGEDSEVAQETLLYVRPVELPEPAYARAVISAPTGNTENFNSRTAIIILIATLTVIATGISISIVMLKKRNNKINYLK